MAASAPRSHWISSLSIALGLALYWLMAVSVSPRMGVTGDEVVHLTGGYSYWAFNDYRLHPENGNLAQRIAALPLLGMGLHFPSFSEPDWLHSRVNAVGEKFFFHEGNPVNLMLLRARMMIALTGAFTVWLTWRWARGLFGPVAGRLALGLAVFCPALLAHGGLATSDMAMTACVLAALSAFWRLLHRATWWRLGLAALACGLAFLSKMSGVIIVPIIAVLVVVRCWRRAPLVLAFGRHVWIRGTAAKIASGIGLAVVVAGGSLAVLWSAYGFRYAGFHPALPAAGYYFTWDEVLSEKPLPMPAKGNLDALLPPLPPPQPTSLDRIIGWTRDHRLLPEAYLWGFAHASKFARYRPAYLMGEHRTQGWWKFFPLAFLLKTPPATILLFLAGLVALGRTWRRPSTRTRFRPWAYRALPLILFFFVYWSMAVGMNLNIGHRHILPTYPVFYIFASAVVLWLVVWPRRMIMIGLFAAVGLQAGESLLARPFYLSYFQPLVGGMAKGYHYLVDSSYDWGQGLPDLERWLENKRRHGDKAPVFLSYFGADSTRARRLEVVRFGDEMNDHGARSYPADLTGGWYVISATHFVRTYGITRGPWTQRHEAFYQDLRQQLQTPAVLNPQTEAERKHQLQVCMEIELLQAARLFHLLQERVPLEIVGGSLLVFKLSDEEVGWALYAPLPSS